MSESYAGKINRKLLKKRRIINAAAGREPADLVKSLCGGEFDPTHYTRYLRRKYTDLYAL